MAIITCPECDQHPVSDRAAACPKCGCPIAAVNALVASVNPSSESPHHAPRIHQERDAGLVGLGAFRDPTGEFPDSSVTVCDLTKLAELVDFVREWCEELVITTGVQKFHIEVISRLSTLKSLSLGLSELDDMALLRISKIRTLCKLQFGINEGRTSEAAWLQLARLSQLELLELPFCPLGPANYDAGKQLERQLQQLLPRTIVKSHMFGT